MECFRRGPESCPPQAFVKGPRDEPTVDSLERLMSPALSKKGQTFQWCDCLKVLRDRVPARARYEREAAIKYSRGKVALQVISFVSSPQNTQASR